MESHVHLRKCRRFAFEPRHTLEFIAQPYLAEHRAVADYRGREVREFFLGMPVPFAHPFAVGESDLLDGSHQSGGARPRHAHRNQPVVHLPRDAGGTHMAGDCAGNDDPDRFHADNHFPVSPRDNRPQRLSPVQLPGGFTVPAGSSTVSLPLRVTEA